MFNISVEDTGNHPQNVLTQIKTCLRTCLKSEPVSLDQLRVQLSSSLSQPGIMGSLYRFMWVDKVGQSYFIIIATNLEDGYGRDKPVLAWAVKSTKLKMTLKELCVASIRSSMENSDDVLELGLPRSLEHDICDLFERTL